MTGEELVEEKAVMETKFINIKWQDGSLHEVGKNGAFMEEVIDVLIERLLEHQQKMPCRENSLAIIKLQEAILQFDARRKDREKRGVLGTKNS